MVTCNHLLDNANLQVVEQLGNIRVMEYQYDLSVTPETAMTSYFASQMNLRRRQVLIELQNDSYIVQAGAMQWTCGAVEAGSGIKGVGDLLGKAIASKVTKESAVKPEYRGSGFLMLEPTYRHILLLDVGQWNGLVLDDGLFLAASGTVPAAGGGPHQCVLGRAGQGGPVQPLPGGAGRRGAGEPHAAR